jgi:hypothetical protein
MGHMMKSTLLRVKEALAEAFPNTAADMLLYGEGWDFGEVFGGARGPNASASRMSGTGIGCFNDRYVQYGCPIGVRLLIDQSVRSLSRFTRTISWNYQ